MKHTYLMEVQVRRFLADTFAMITFSTVVGMVVEILISGLTFGQSAQARLTAIPANLLTARLYGMFRDGVFRFVGADKGGQVIKGVADIVAFVLFQVPLYATILAFSGADLHQIMTACGTVTVLSGFMGRPYGIIMDFSRQIFGFESHTRN